MICLFSFLSLSLSCVVPNVWSLHTGFGDMGHWRGLHHTHVVVLLDSRSGSIFFRYSAGPEPGGRCIHHMCASTTRCCTCGTHHRWSIYTAMRSSWAYVFTDNVPTGTSSRRRSSRTVRLLESYEDLHGIEDGRVRLYQPRSRGNVSRLTVYIRVCYRFPPITGLVLDRSWALGVR